MTGPLSEAGEEVLSGSSADAENVVGQVPPRCHCPSLGVALSTEESNTEHNEQIAKHVHVQRKRSSINKVVFKRPVVAFDVDDVLGCYLQGCIDWHNKKYGTTLKFSDFFSYNFAEVWGGSDEEALDKCTEYMTSEGFKELKVMEGATQAVYHLANKFDLVVVTSRQSWIREETIRWLTHHFPGAFKQFLFGNHWVKDPNAKKFTKRELCESVGAVALIDDNPKYVLSVADSHSIQKAILFDRNLQNGWSKNVEIPEPLKPKIVRCSNWDQVCVEIEKLPHA